MTDLSAVDAVVTPPRHHHHHHHPHTASAPHHHHQPVAIEPVSMSDPALSAIESEFTALVRSLAEIDKDDGSVFCNVIKGMSVNELYDRLASIESYELRLQFQESMNRTAQQHTSAAPPHHTADPSTPHSFSVVLINGCVFTVHEMRVGRDLNIMGTGTNGSAAANGSGAGGASAAAAAAGTSSAMRSLSLPHSPDAHAIPSGAGAASAAGALNSSPFRPSATARITALSSSAAGAAGGVDPPSSPPPQVRANSHTRAGGPSLLHLPSSPLAPPQQQSFIGSSPAKPTKMEI